MATGTVKFFNDEKGFGFISRDGDSDVFVHFSNIEGSGRRTLLAGQQVEFELGEGRKGVEANNVKVIS
ncbi:MAG: cold-shock protein [Acidimicrobiaceae bacterium]|jgi:CspA family cold shock protein|nr:cold-shock protein [Ilumatobacteraceae bacterium]NQW68704.1 cold-shock protein [Acidimicrobiaceae bacterium]